MVRGSLTRPDLDMAMPFGYTNVQHQSSPAAKQLIARSSLNLDRGATGAH